MYLLSCVWKVFCVHVCVRFGFRRGLLLLVFHDVDVIETKSGIIKYLDVMKSFEKSISCDCCVDTLGYGIVNRDYNYKRKW